LLDRPLTHRLFTRLARLLRLALARNPLSLQSLLALLLLPLKLDTPLLRLFSMQLLPPTGPHPFRWTVSNLSFRPVIVIQRIPQRSLPPQAAEVPC
jgi:hypothetical protein